MSRIPKTKGKLSLSAKFFVSLDSGASTADIPAGVPNGKFTWIGSMERFEEANPRSTTPRYQLDYDDPGEIIERLPGLVDRTLTITKTVLYNEDLMSVFGTSDLNDIIGQDSPFAIAKVDKDPDGNLKTTLFTGCWLHANPKAYNMSTELKMVQTAEIGYARRYVV